MGLTEFDGFIVIQPMLPQTLVDTINSLCTFRNNTYGDGDLNSFDAVVHHLHGPPAERTWAMYQSKKDGTSKTPSVWCRWTLANRRVPHQGTWQTTLEWDREERFNDYMYWLQYLVDFILLLAERQYGISIAKFAGQITWEGVYDKDDRGLLQVVRRQHPETTGFHPDNFLPLPHPKPVRNQQSLWRDDQQDAVCPPKGKPFLSHFGVEVRVQPRDPMVLARRADLELDQGVSRGGYVLLLDELPVKHTVVFHVHHERSHTVFCPDDPELYDKHKAFHNPEYLQSLAIAEHIQLATIGGLATPPISPDTDRGVPFARQCILCRRPFPEAAGRLAAWCWPHGYDGAFSLTVYCRKCCQQ